MALNKSECRQVATEEVDRLEREYPPEVLGMIRQILAERTAKPKGRRVEADWDALLEMARLLRDEVAVSVCEAAGMVCDQVGGLSREAIIDRLRGKYRNHQARLQEELVEETTEDRGVAAVRAEIKAGAARRRWRPGTCDGAVGTK